MENFGEKLRTLRKQHNLTIRQLAENLEIKSSGYITELEKGFRGLILMDIMMPGMDGWQTIREIVKKGLMKNVAIGIITGKGTKNHHNMDGLSCYIYDYFSKPLNIKELVKSVENCPYF